MSQTETPEISPQVIHLFDLLKWVREGRLRVPEFQRDFVWKRQDILDLFDSLKRQYPIGSIFLWKSNTKRRHRDHIGPFQVPAREDFSLVLDGQQRLTTLVGVLLADETGWDESDDEDAGRWRVYYDAAEEQFLHPPRDVKPPPFMLPIKDLSDTVKMFGRFQDLLTYEPSSASKWIERAQQVARALQSYRIPIIEFKTENLTTAVDGFSRLNRRGRPMGQDEMFSALTYAEDDAKSFHMAREIDALHEDMVRSGFGEVERVILLRAVLAAAELDIYRTDWTRLSEELQNKTLSRLPEAVEEARRGLEAARAFLRAQGVHNVRILPYNTQLVALSAFFGRCPEPTQAQQTFLERWFWSSSFAAWFGLGNSARVRRLIDELRDEISQQPAPTTLKFMEMEQEALPMPLRFDFRSARVRTLLCVLLRRKPPRSPQGALLSPQELNDLFLTRGPEVLTRICATVKDRDLQGSPANRLLDLGAERGQAKTWLLALPPDKRDIILESHAITPAAFACLEQGDNNAFLQERLRTLTDLELEFMKQVGVTPPRQTQPAPAPLDTDE
jgi:hypothetical protein